MANDTNISMAAAIAACDAIVNLIDGGTGTNPMLKIYNGSQPADPDTAVGGQTLLATIDLGSATVFGNAATGTGDFAEATASAILPKSDTTAAATGTATWFRVLNKSGTAIIDGTVGTSGCDLNLDSASITAGQTVKINTWAFRMPNL